VAGLDETRREACRLRKAIRELLAKHPDGLTLAEIINLLLSYNKFTGTRRNLEFQSKAILQAMLDQKKIEVSESGTLVFKSRQ
jgi:hypothetical protein